MLTTRCDSAREQGGPIGAVPMASVAQPPALLLSRPHILQTRWIGQQALVRMQIDSAPPGAAEWWLFDSTSPFVVVNAAAVPYLTTVGQLPDPLGCRLGVPAVRIDCTTITTDDGTTITLPPVNAAAIDLSDVVHELNQHLVSDPHASTDQPLQVNEFAGLLGYPLLSLFLFELNYPLRRIAIHPRWAELPGVEIPFSLTPGNLMTIPHQVDSLPTSPWLVDTRRRRSQISYELAYNVNLTPNPPLEPLAKLPSNCIDGTAPAVPTGWRRMSSNLGRKIQLTQLTYLVPTCPRDLRLRGMGGALGTDILASFVVFFDYTRGRLIFGFDPNA